MCPEIETTPANEFVGCWKYGNVIVYLRGGHATGQVSHGETDKEDQASSEKPTPCHGDSGAVRQVVPDR